MFEIMRGAGGADGPGGRGAGIVLAEIAGGIDRLGQNIELALVALAAIGDDAGVLLQTRGHALHHRVFHIIGKHDMVGIDRLAAGLNQHDMAGGGDDIGRPVDRHLIGMQCLAILDGDDMAGGGYEIGVFLVGERIGGEADGRVLPGAGLGA